jgi:hypothetical protein
MIAEISWTNTFKYHYLMTLLYLKILILGNVLIFDIFDIIIAAIVKIKHA